LESENRNRREQTTQKIERLQAQLDDSRNEFSAMEKKILNVTNQEEEDKRQKDEMELELRRAERELRDLEKSIRDMQSQKENRLRAFGHGMPELVEDIDREKRWRGRAPVGPFGRYIKLERPEFANVLETTVGRMLNNFVVETFEDKRLLAQMLDRRKL
jgi:chromosome segregation ATPase